MRARRPQHPRVHIYHQHAHDMRANDILAYTRKCTRMRRHTRTYAQLPVHANCDRGGLIIQPQILARKNETSFVACVQYPEGVPRAHAHMRPCAGCGRVQHRHGGVPRAARRGHACDGRLRMQRAAPHCARGRHGAPLSPTPEHAPRTPRAFVRPSSRLR